MTRPKFTEREVAKPKFTERRRAHASRRATASDEMTATTTASAPSADSIADAARQQMISEAAYYRAEKRGFAPGYELDDWLAAEAELTSSALQEEPASELH